MDCEKFDQHVIDALYDELDELNAAALERHVEGCTRCAQIFSQLKDAREAATMPLVEPSVGLEERILAAEKAAVRKAPVHIKVIRGIAWAGSLAMRPQLAMAALFMLIVGSSLLLLRGKPNALVSPTQVTQRGEPGAESEESDEAPLRSKSEAKAARPDSPPSPAAARPRNLEKADDNAAEPQTLSKSPAATALASGAPESLPMASAAVPPPGDAKAELAEADALKNAQGCGAALGKYAGIAGKYPTSPEGLIAQSELSKCKPTPASPTKPLATTTTPTR